MASLTVTRSSGPLLYAVAPFLVLHTLAAVSSSRNFAGRPASSLDADTTVAPEASEVRFGATLNVSDFVVAGGDRDVA